MKVLIVIYVHAWDTNTDMQEWICVTCSNTCNVEGDQYFSSQHARTFKFPDWQLNVHFPWPNELTICPDINGFQIPDKTMV